VQRAGDWYAAICDYLDNPQKVADHVTGSRKLILQTLSPETLGKKWFDQLTAGEEQQVYNAQVVQVVYP
jgi:hypothetical protein